MLVFKNPAVSYRLPNAIALFGLQISILSVPAFNSKEAIPPEPATPCLKVKVSLPSLTFIITSSVSIFVDENEVNPNKLALVEFSEILVLPILNGKPSKSPDGETETTPVAEVVNPPAL